MKGCLAWVIEGKNIHMHRQAASRETFANQPFKIINDFLRPSI
ncbi:hypothetical protein DB42_AY00030 [Neochlamydia sp. EPS4]|nr:hypothetical protein DB42_AY00030 [Neochlamydia sp. EPS4]